MTAKSSSALNLRQSAGMATVVDDSTSQLYAVELYSRDLEWETTLLTLLSELEQRLTVLTPRRFLNDPCETVHRLGELLAHLDLYTASHATGQLLIADRLGDARILATRYQTALETLPKSLPQRNLFGFTNRRDPVTIRHQETCRLLLGDLPKILEGYLMALANGFTTGQGAAKWIETCSVFQRQANKLVVFVLG